jgi:sugar O-acyltransferase (sialic acid O-acetyltransferase NeuD family)
MVMKRVVLVGAGGHAKVVWDTLRLMQDREQTIEVVGVVDDDPQRWGQQFLGLPIVGPVSTIAQAEADAAIIAIGNNRDRQRLYETIVAMGMPLVNAIHPTAVIAADVQIGHGVAACANVVINIGTVIGDNVILNTGCIVDHDCIIGPHVHLAPGVRLAGAVTVGEGTLMGVGAVATPGVAIGRWVTVGAGGVVVDDLPDGVAAVGVPAHVQRK